MAEKVLALNDIRPSAVGAFISQSVGAKHLHAIELEKWLEDVSAERLKVSPQDVEAMLKELGPVLPRAYGAQAVPGLGIV